MKILFIGRLLYILFWMLLLRILGRIVMKSGKENWNRLGFTI